MAREPLGDGWAVGEAWALGDPAASHLTAEEVFAQLEPVHGRDGVWDPNVASPARMYDYWLGGKDHSQVDRDAADAVSAAAPSIPAAAKANRAFMHRAVAWCAEQGIDQFIDVGTGIPTAPNPHQIARRFQPGALVVGVDNDPIVLAHDRALLEGMPILRGDVRAPDALIVDLSEPIDGASIDWDRPVAVLLVAVLHFVTGDAAGVVRAFAGRMVPGSVVVLSHVSSTGADPEAVAQIEAVYRESATTPGVARTRGQITDLFGRLEVVSPGVVPVQHWPTVAGPLTAMPVMGGVGVVPDPLAGER